MMGIDMRVYFDIDSNGYSPVILPSSTTVHELRQLKKGNHHRVYSWVDSLEATGLNGHRRVNTACGADSFPTPERSNRDVAE